MKKLLLVHLIIFTTALQAQVYRDRIGYDLESIVDMDFGWMKMYKYTSPATGKQLGNRFYSANQIGYSQQFIEWMQASYLPKGCLGNAGYIHFYIPPKIIGDYPVYVVIFTKDNELPFDKVTIGEFFTEAEKKIPIWQNIDPVPAEQFAAAQKNLARLISKYRNKWNEVANLRLSGTDLNLQAFVNATEDHEDFFDNKDIYGKEGVYTTFPIMKARKGVRELCKTDTPQWLVIRWTMGMPNQAFNKHLHESILNNFNFEYAYNYFFHPEKVKGQSYKPLYSPSAKTAVALNAVQNQ